MLEGVNVDGEVVVVVRVGELTKVIEGRAVTFMLVTVMPGEDVTD